MDCLPRSRPFTADIAIHVPGCERVIYLVGRFARLVLIAALPVLAAGAGLSDLLKAVEQRYNRARTLEVIFVQTFTWPGGRRTVERGELFLRKPGRMLWRYRSPEGKLFVSDGKFFYLYTPSSNRVEKMSMKESDDLRAPLGFLLGRLDFWRDFRKFTSRPEGLNVRIVADPKSDQLPYTRVEFVVTPQHAIQYLHVTGQDNSVMEYTFENERLNPALPDKMFQFQVPPGAELADTSGEVQDTR